MSLDRERREIIKISNIAEKPLFVPKSNKKKAINKHAPGI